MCLSTGLLPVLPLPVTFYSSLHISDYVIIIKHNATKLTSLATLNVIPRLVRLGCLSQMHCSSAVHLHHFTLT